MQYLFLWILSVPFIYINVKIIISDIYNKTITNKYLIYLLYLVPFIFSYNYYYHDSNILLLFLQTIIGIIISFILYYKWIWSAWDAKYLLILSLFFSNTGIVPFLGNIAILVISYLLLYYLYFYIGKGLLNITYAKSLYQNIYIDLKEKIITFIRHSDGNIYTGHSFRVLLNWLLIFLFIFIGFRLIRLLLISNLATHTWGIIAFEEIFKKYHIYISILTFLIFLLWKYFFNKIFQIGISYIWKKLNIKHDKGWLILPLILICILIWAIILEYIKNPYEIINFLYVLSTFYIVLFLIMKILIYSYRVTFQVAETYFIKIDNLEKWEIIDKQYLAKMFWEQACLWYGEASWLLHPNPKDYFLNLENPIDEETRIKIQEIFSITNTYHKNNNEINFGQIDNIKILKTFSFAPYILFWFFLTYLFKDAIFLLLANSIISFLKNFHS